MDDGFYSPMRNSGTLGRDLKHNLSPYNQKPRRQRTGARRASTKKTRCKSTSDIHSFRGVTLDSMDNHRDKPTPYAWMPREETEQHISDEGTGFLTIGSQAATHQYDVNGTWKKLYTKTISSGDDSSSSLNFSP